MYSKNIIYDPSYIPSNFKINNEQRLIPFLGGAIIGGIGGAALNSSNKNQNYYPYYNNYYPYVIPYYPQYYSPYNNYNYYYPSMYM